MVRLWIIFPSLATPARAFATVPVRTPWEDPLGNGALHLAAGGGPVSFTSSILRKAISAPCDSMKILPRVWETCVATFTSLPLWRILIVSSSHSHTRVFQST